MKLIFDGSHLLHRVKYIAEDETVRWDFYCFVFIRTVLKFMNKYHCKDATVCWDKSGSKRRKKLFPDHKIYPPIDMETKEGQDLQKSLTAYIDSRSWLDKNLYRMGIKSVMVQGIEADDITYILVNILDKMGDKGVLITEDKDWVQSLKPGWVLYRPLQDTITTYENFCEKYTIKDINVDPKVIYTSIKAFIGKANEIPKIEGIGEVWAEKALYYIFNGIPLGNGIKATAIKDALANETFSRNVELADYSLVERSEIRQVAEIYEKSEKKLEIPDLFNWLDLGDELNSTQMLTFSSYLNF